MMALNPWLVVFMVFIGGGSGSVCRYLLGRYLTMRYELIFPVGTLTINILGCLLIGFLVATLQRHTHWSPTLTPLLVTGFCGGFTTFSTFSHEHHLLFRQGEYGFVFLYTSLSITFGLLATGLGLWLAERGTIG